MNLYKSLLLIPILFISLFLFSAEVNAAGVLKVHPENPRYFTDDSGDAIYLTGSHTWYLIHSSSKDPSYDDFENYLDWMQSHGHNFVRLWTGWGAYTHNRFPWKRTGPGNALDGNLKFDMTNLNQEYFDIVRERVLQVQNRGMYASVMFFGSIIHTHTSDGWVRLAWHEDNNINPELANAFNKTDGHSFFTTNSAALEIQKNSFVNL